MSKQLGEPFRTLRPGSHPPRRRRPLVRAESLLDPLVGHPVLFPEAAERGDELIDRSLRHGLIPALEGSHLLGEAEEALHGLTLGRGPPPGIQGAPGARRRPAGPRRPDRAACRSWRPR